MDTTNPVMTFVINQIKSKKIQLTIVNKKTLRKAFKSSIDPYLFRHANWSVIAKAIIELEVTHYDG